jgi:hypothetical protein
MGIRVAERQDPWCPLPRVINRDREIFTMPGLSELPSEI